MLGVGRAGHGEGGRGPLDPPGVAVDQGDLRAVDLEVVELLRVDPGYLAGGPQLLEVLDSCRRCVGSVIPPLERGDRHRVPKYG
jgi:hypothetical protein